MQKKTFAATGLVVALGLGSLLASPAGADAPSGSVASATGSSERVWFVGSGDCVWGVIPILGHRIIVMEPCEKDYDEDD